MTPSNYWRNPDRASPVNLAVVRVLTGLYAVWKLLSYEWLALSTYPYVVFAESPHAYLVSPVVLDVLPALVAVTVGLILAVVVGYRLAATGFLSAVLLAYLSGVHYAVSNQGSTFLPVVYLLLLFALFSSEDRLSVDAIRRTAGWSTASLNRRLTTDTPETYRHSALQWTLLVVAFVYFFTGLGKILDGGAQWATAGNLSRTILTDSYMYLDGVPPVGRFIIEHEVLALGAGAGTLVLELGFVFVVVLGAPLWPAVVGLLGMHTFIAVGMHILFFDQYLLFTLFLPWDDIYGRLWRPEPLTVLYDDDCHVCARLLYPFELLDVDDSIEFVTPATAPERCPSEVDAPPTTAVSVFDERGDGSHGYRALRYLAVHSRVLAPLGWAMGIGPCATLCQSAYDRATADRAQQADQGAENRSSEEV
ncbi:hypothetical protein [Salinigranum marinum]|uniref:hypothetical protein n=1 Tax=Salinigranum marinum TaxID=1515595 RepID=UPI00298A057E|nr:hypothetical protein [Salinigranum marinum]